jgi:adenylosuccinate synthase
MKKYPEYRKFITDTTELLNKALNNGKNILLEGAQGTLLDIDFGTYPYVTSSHPTAGGASIGSGIPPWKINSVIGVVKAYTTRVGEGPFPTELFDDCGKKMAERGVEFGATTGRPRRCGWLDLVALKYACEINGVTEIVLTKSDVLDEFDEILVCIGYENNNLKFSRFIPYVNFLNTCKPIYKSFKGWKSSLNQFKDYKSLPPEFHHYVEFIESFVNTKISYISTGASREEMISRN